MKIAICAALYEAGRPFLVPFIDAVGAAVAAYDALFVAAIDGLRDCDSALAGLPDRLDRLTVEVPPGHTPAGVRRWMLDAAAHSGADVLVFVDMDDVIAPTAIDNHLAALAAADFSYGDLELIDAAGQPLGRRFFDGARVPERVGDLAAICDRNFLGFSNTAVRADRLSPVALTVPDDVVAADWWFFTMLVLGGLRGQRTAAPVGAYRMHGANALGAGGPRTIAEVIGQSEAMLRHYRAFAAQPALAGRAAAVENLLAAVHGVPADDVAARLDGLDRDTGAWFETISRLADSVAAPAARMAAS